MPLVVRLRLPLARSLVLNAIFSLTLKLTTREPTVADLVGTLASEAFPSLCMCLFLKKSITVLRLEGLGVLFVLSKVMARTLSATSSSSSGILACTGASAPSPLGAGLCFRLILGIRIGKTLFFPSSSSPVLEALKRILSCHPVAITSTQAKESSNARTIRTQQERGKRVKDLQKRYLTMKQKQTP